MARNDSYWGDAPPLDEIVFKLLPIESARIAAFEAGELDAMISGIDETADKEEANGVQVVSPPPTGYTFLFMNQTRPPFDDVRVRQALTSASDRDAIASAYQGQGYADFSWSPFVKDTEWWAAPETPIAFDPDASGALLDDYGQPVEFTYLLLAGNQTTEDVSRATVEYYNEAGIDVEIEIIADLTTYVTKVITRRLRHGRVDRRIVRRPRRGDLQPAALDRPEQLRQVLQPRDGRLARRRPHRDRSGGPEAVYDDVQELFRAEVPYLMASHGSLYVIANDNVTGLGGTLALPARTAGFTAG